LFKVVDEELFISTERLFLRAGNVFTGPDTLLLDGR
jgi:hypothetical protein